MDVFTPADVREVEQRVPTWAKIIGFALMLVSLGWTAHTVLAEQRIEAIEARVEQHIEEYEPLLKFLVCDQLATDPTACVFILRGTTFYDEFRSIGLLPPEN